jgi:hypothetical protein
MHIIDCTKTYDPKQNWQRDYDKNGSRTQTHMTQNIIKWL